MLLLFIGEGEEAVRFSSSNSIEYMAGDVMCFSPGYKNTGRRRFLCLSPLAVWCFLALLLLNSCAVSKKYTPAQRFSPAQLQQDYSLFRNILQTSHPSLYWYTPQDSVDWYFEWGRQQLTDSLREYQFRNILSYVIASIRCGHTTVRPSRGAALYAERTRGVAFPLNIKTWGDTAVVLSNLNRKDSLITRGVVLTAINGQPFPVIRDSLFRFISADGYNISHKAQTLSNGAVFRSMYGAVYGLKSKNEIEYIDLKGIKKKSELNWYNPVADTPAKRTGTPPAVRPTRKEVRRLSLSALRSLRIDTASGTAFMNVSVFSGEAHLRSFLRRSFRRIQRQGIQNVVVDMRANGGGSVVLSNLLTRYLADKPFKIADSLYALHRSSPYRKYIQDYWPTRLFLLLMTHKKEDGHYHFSMYENKYFKPVKRYHFKGTAYIVTGGNTFSAASLFTKALKEQNNVVIVGEETGGGAYGNSAWLIPDVILPNTKVRFKLPLFRLVVDKAETRGYGIIPETEVLPTVEAIRKGKDYKLDKVMEMIRESAVK